MTADVPAPADAWVHAEAVIRDPTGLHARPAVKLTKLAKRFAARVELRAEGATDWANAKSPNAVMKLKAGHATRLGIRAAGDDAGAAAEALRALVDANFDEPPGT
jgi:phosphocarrier protein HPr